MRPSDRVLAVVPALALAPRDGRAQSYPIASPDGSGVVTYPPSDEPQLPPPRTALMISGAIVHGIPWSLTLIAGATADAQFRESTLLGMIPVAGPFVAMGTLPPVEGAWFAGVLYFADGFVQTIGATLFLVGLGQHLADADRNDRLRRARRSASWSLAPGAPGAPAGLSLRVTSF